MRQYWIWITTLLSGWPRRLAACCCLLLAVHGAASGSARPSSASRPTVVAARDLGAGSVLGPADVALVRVPAAAVPSTRLSSTSSAVGRRLAGPVAKGEVLTGGRLVGRELSSNLSPGQVECAVAVAAAALAFVHPGDRVDLVSDTQPAAGSVTGSDSDAPAVAAAPALAAAATTVAAHDVLVLAALPASAESADGSGAQLIVAADPDTAQRLAAAGERATLAVLGRAP